MFQITPQLREHLTKNFGLPADATESAARELLGAKMMSSEVSMDQVRELTKSAATGGADKVRTLVAEEVGKAFEPLTAKIGQLVDALAGKATQVGGAVGAAGSAGTDGAKAPLGVGVNPRQALIAGAGTGVLSGDDHIRIKSVVEMFDDTKTSAVYGTHSKNEYLQKNFAGTRVYNGTAGELNSRPMDMPTERTKAIAGAWFKYMAWSNSGGRGIRLTDLDRQIVEYALHECKFTGPIRPVGDDAQHSQFDLSGTKLTDLQRKALLDDSTSGGLEAVPIEFDDAVIITPLLNGELFPLITQRVVTRRRIEAFSIGNPTLSWGVAEGSDIPLFNTDSFIAAFDTTIYPVTGSIEVGLDFEADSPVGVGDIIIDRYGEVFLKEMDKMVAIGSGTNQPKGVRDTTGITSVSAENGNTGPPTVTDYELLLFALAKEYRDAGSRARQVFIANETSYQRVRSVKVGTSDQRRVFGMDHESYVLLTHPYKIQQGIANTVTMFANLRYMRWYRRQGYQTRVVTEDADLARRNQRLILVRARMGGQMELAGACAKTTNAQS